MIPLFLIGCGIGTGTSTKIPTTTLTGTEGIIAEFSKNAPAKTIFENTNFPVLIKIRNAGTYSIPKDPSEQQGIISIGREKDYVPKLSI